MVNTLLKEGDYNVINVDWTGGSGASLIDYAQATANTRVVGLELANFISYLKNNVDLILQDIHIMGFSLGSHIAGE